MHRKVATLAILAVMAGSPAVAAVILVQTGDPGYYNNTIGTVLNGTNGGETGPFPVSNDSNLTFPVAPDLSAASSALGNWLTDPLNLNSNWQALAAIPNSWTPGSEVAVMYQFNTLSATNVVASLGVDNGIFVWLDGTYLFGARGPGSFVFGEYVVPVGDLTAGTHFLQLLLEDHGSINGYAVQVTADTFIPGPPPSEVPEPSTYALFLIGAATLGANWWHTRRTTRP
ncbi:MAG: PEP-CTERM sorting domain-containing protein [Bryobacteraceae bacterium]|nr:PEP-CTERM sorting domain-containing protein [Bryobacterales bacterium]NUN00900.1 PEP-CTERM sorting domain-containing protein [Bryobacteraceae bacterium]